jgi:hypothetical protein
VAIACHQDNPTSIAVSNGVVYWTNNDLAQNIMSVPITGGTPTVVASNQDYPWAIAVDDKNVYWTLTGSPDGGTTSGAVRQAPIGGGTVITLSSTLENPGGIAVDSENVYFTTEVGGNIHKFPIGGGTGISLAESQASPAYIAVSGGNVYWTNLGNGTVATVPASGTGPTTPTVLATDAANSNAEGIAVNGSTVFFSAANNPGYVWSVPTTGGTAKALFIVGQNTPWGVAVDSTNAYWVTNTNPGGLYMVPLTGGTPTTLTSGLENPTAVAVDSSGVYTAGQGGNVWRIMPTSQVTFSGGQAYGAMNGSGFVEGGTAVAGNIGAPLTTFTSPTCPAGDGQLTGSTGPDAGTGCTATAWTGTGLCMSGTIPAVSGTPANYAEDWGAMVAASVGTPFSTTLGGSYTSIAATYTGAPGGDTRLLVDVAGTQYCVDAYVSGTTVTTSQLVTNCYTGGTPQTPLSSLGAIDWVGLLIPSSTAAETFTNFCMTGIRFQ